ncbi:hypothetical protein ACCUM_1698 [Candidatus Accumulibacter phosphatis]|uniref:Uncharacterized protein n=1 Tax=Candidatus Accumulibacter phosphatis TaxID=327160 RepID=A0A5S4EJ33_9PROT|nr:hypothetical protein ACCUM_1698 [Candidatus Accumulibacter phosphatis]
MADEKPREPPHFKPHVAPKPLLAWLHRNGSDQASRKTASRAVSIYNA